MSDVTGGGDTVVIKEMPLICRHCGGGSFLRTDAGPTGAPVIAYACEACGMVHLFLDSVEPQGPADRYACLECGMVLPAEMETCVACGWTYRSAAVEEPSDLAPVADDACLACGEHFPPEATSCPACGWTFDAGDPTEAPPQEPPYGEPAPTATDEEPCPTCGASREGSGIICRSCGRILG